MGPANENICNVNPVPTWNGSEPIDKECLLLGTVVYITYVEYLMFVATILEWDKDNCF